MGSTETRDAGRVVELGPADLPEALALSLSASWNQNEADWRTMLALGRGWGIRAAGADSRQTLAASTLVIPYGPAFAWVSMVLVQPAFRRRGYASLLLRHALAELRAQGRTAVLDATPAGYTVYVQEGFAPHWGFRRHRREAASGLAHDRTAGTIASGASRPLAESDWPGVLALDRPAFGADREALLRSLAQRLPQAARAVERDGRIAGFVLGRDGREAAQLGPLLADDPSIARGLLADALAAIEGPVYLDLADRHDTLLPWLQSHGFAFQRPFTRMVLGAPTPPGDPARIVLVAGPELG